MAGTISLWDPSIVRHASLDAVKKLDPRVQVKNPVMFIVEVGSLLTTVVFLQERLSGTGQPLFTGQVAFWLWFTVLFANFAEAMAEGRGKAQADTLRKTRTEPLISVLNKSINQTLSRTLLTGGTVLLASGALLVLGGDVLRGIAFVLFVGVIIGTYSSIYVASPFALLWAQRFGKEAQRLKSGAAQQLKPQQPAPKAKRAAGSRR